jgi:hypothetical protein
MSSIGLAVPTELDEIPAFLQTLITAIEIELGNSNYFVPTKIMPSKVRAGRVYFFSQTIAPDITAVGWWGFDGTTWKQLA